MDGVQDGEGEGCGFPGACLGAAEEVATFKQERDGLLLDGGWEVVFEFVENFFQGRGKSHRFKCSGHICFQGASLYRESAASGVDEGVL